MKKTGPQCGLLIENAEGRVLLQLLDDNPAIPYPNSWGTFGGQVEEGETPLQAIKREIREELDYDAAGAEFFGTYPFHGYDIYMFRKVDPDIRLDTLTVNEGQGAQFFSRDELRHVQCAFNCREIVEDYFRRFGKG